MILIIAKACVKRDRTAQFKETALELVENSRSEDGCIEYSLYEDRDNECSLTFVEKWRDQTAIDQHGSTEFFKERISRLTDFSESLEISFNQEV